ncbi:MAG: glycoside hydrolase family 99-like domain-containing protein [Armatimonadota bacterium]
MKTIPAPKPVTTDMLVGAYYFPGWAQADRWYCMAANDKVQHPLLGYYREGDPDAADWHIKWAVEHGVSFFAFDFYSAKGSQMLETALDDGFLKAKYISKFKFCLNWCNHAPYTTMDAEELERFGDLVIKKYLAHPSYLRIDGKPVVIFLSGYSFVKNLGVEPAKAEIQKFKDRCKDAGLNGAYIIFCEGETNGIETLKQSKIAGADAFCLYNYPYAGSDMTGPGKYAEYTYKHLIEQGENIWKSWSVMNENDFWPTVMPGWDRRPWLKDTDLIRTGSTPELFAESLKRARNYVNKDKVVMIEAWNEWGEGSILEPSVEKGFAYLDKVREVFAPNAPKHTDTDPKSLGMRQPVFDLKLPSADTWKFNFGIEEWTTYGTTGLTANWGALVTKSTSTDPQLNSPKTYLRCKDYPKLHIRMRLSKNDKGSETGQIFWSTVDSGLSEKTSMNFQTILDGEWHDYEINLAANPNWKGRTDQFRLDPAGIEGIEINIDEIVFKHR